jgi:signal transduction histidine kinase
MIDQLLDLSLARQGPSFPVRPREANLGDVCHKVLEEVLAANPGTRVEQTQAGELGGAWDPDRLEQVVSNLVGNAVQHGQPSAPVTVELDGTREELVRLTVENVGAVPLEAVPTLFEPFKATASRAATKGGRRGFGLGLFIAREIVRAHGGELSVEVRGDHTRFEATLPRGAHRPLSAASRPGRPGPP